MTIDHKRVKVKTIPLTSELKFNQIRSIMPNNDEYELHSNHLSLLVALEKPASFQQYLQQTSSAPNRLLLLIMDYTQTRRRTTMQFFNYSAGKEEAKQRNNCCSAIRPHIQMLLVSKLSLCSTHTTTTTQTATITK